MKALILNNMKKVTFIKLSLIAFVGALILVTGCKKDDPTLVKITVFDEENFRVSDAAVKLYGKPTVDENGQVIAQEVRFDETKFTDLDGLVQFDLSEYRKPGQAGFVVLDIEITKNGLQVDGVIRVKEEETNEKTFILE